jgi:hypothetical protein
MPRSSRELLLLATPPHPQARSRQATGAEFSIWSQLQGGTERQWSRSDSGREATVVGKRRWSLRSRGLSVRLSRTHQENPLKASRPLSLPFFPPLLRGIFKQPCMPRGGVMRAENVGGAVPAATWKVSSPKQIAARSAPPTFGKAFS